MKVRLEKKEMAKRIVGWTAVAVTVLFASLWSYLSIMRYYQSANNFFLFFLQYLLFTLALVASALVSMKWQKAGLGLHVAVAAFFAWFFSLDAFTMAGPLIAIPLFVLGILYFLGRPEPRKWACRLTWGLPLIVILGLTMLKLF